LRKNFFASTQLFLQRLFFKNHKHFPMKKLFCLSLFVLSLFAARSQAVATNLKFNKADRPALMLELPYDPAVAEQFILDTLRKSGYEPQTSGIFKNKKVNGFYVFKGVRLPGSDRTTDLYFKVEPKSKRQENVSIVYLLMDKGNEDFVNSGDGAVHSAGKSLMNDMVPQSAVFKLQLDIKGQEEAVRNAEKRMEKLTEDEKKLNQKIEELQNNLKKNKEDQEIQKKTIENEKLKLQELRLKA
jgi:hypothetical protein